MSGVADKLAAITATSEAELEGLRGRRRELALAALSDDTQARAALAAVSLEISAIEDRLDLAALAVEQEAERERAAAEAEAEAERKRLEAEVDRLEAELAAALRGLQRSAIATGKASAQAVQIGAELVAARAALDLPAGRSVSGLVSALVVVRSRDECPQLHYVHIPAFTRQQLIETFPIVDVDEPAPVEPTVDEPVEPVSKPACSVCSHDSSAEIQQALAAGETVRSIAEQYGVSKSALSRHRAHSG